MSCCEDLRAFELLVRAQQPATEDWRPVTAASYSYESRKAVEGKHPQLILDTFHPTRIIDVGGAGGHLTPLLRELGATVDCLDIAGPGDYIQQDIADWRMFNWLEPDSYDLVICREVLEHLTLKQIRWAVTNLCLLSSKFVYVTTRFSSEHDLLRVETHDELDPTHITLAAKDLYRLLFALEGLRQREDLEAAMDWQGKGRCLVYEHV